MTRINCIPVTELADQHLLAEYREITRVSKLARRLDDYGQYTMGAGHVKFFYDKGGYLATRTEELYDECQARGFNVGEKVYRPHPQGLNNDWSPTAADSKANWARILEKYEARPNFYTNRRDSRGQDETR